MLAMVFIVLPATVLITIQISHSQTSEEAPPDTSTGKFRTLEQSYQTYLNDVEKARKHYWETWHHADKLARQGKEIKPIISAAYSRFSSELRTAERKYNQRVSN